MKKFHKLLVITVLLGAHVSSVQALSWDQLSSLGKDSITPYAYTVETSGHNIRGYEYRSPSGKICTVNISSTNMSLSCEFPPAGFIWKGPK